MTPFEFLKEMRSTAPGERLQIPGPLVTYVGQNEAFAAEVLVYLTEHHPELRPPEVLAVLHSASWWMTLLDGLPSQLERDEPAPSAPAGVRPPPPPWPKS